MNLTDQQLNEEICQWRGWKRVEVTWPFGMFWRWLMPGKELGSDGEWTERELPSHITGIEALGNMHTLAATQDEAFQDRFAIHLERRAGNKGVHVHQLAARDWAEVALEAKP